MPRRVQDIVPNTHRSIRDIPVERPSSMVAPIQPPRQRGGRSIPLRKPEKSIDKEEVIDMPEAGDEAKVPSKRGTFIPQRQRSGSSTRKWLIILMGIIILVAVVGYLASVYFSYASFNIVPKTIPLSINSTYISKNIPEQGVLTYELAAVSGSAEITVPATDGQNVSTKAKGKITVYNSYSASSQLLIAGTRFSDDSGKIYRLTSSISVPGYTTRSGTVVPGSITAEVTADQPGQSYNITRTSSISDFKIVAYKGTPRYEKMYGRIASDITGGFVGITKSVDPKTMSSTTADLKARITSSLIAEIQNTIPDGFIMYPDAYVIDFSDPVIGGDDPKSAKVSMRGTMHGILFDKKELVNRIVGEKAIETFDGFPYETSGLEQLDFSIANLKDFSPEKKNTLIIKLKGDASVSGTIPVDELKTKLGGLSLSETGDVLRQYKPVIEIEKSSGSITPPWSKVPTDADRITIDVSPIGSSEGQ